MTDTAIKVGFPICAFLFSIVGLCLYFIDGEVLSSLLCVLIVVVCIGYSAVIKLLEKSEK